MNAGAYPLLDVLAEALRRALDDREGVSPFLTTEEAARYLRVEPSTLRGWVAAGFELAARRV